MNTCFRVVEPKGPRSSFVGFPALSSLPCIELRYSQEDPFQYNFCDENERWHIDVSGKKDVAHLILQLFLFSTPVFLPENRGYGTVHN